MVYAHQTEQVTSLYRNKPMRFFLGFFFLTVYLCCFFKPAYALTDAYRQQQLDANFDRVPKTLKEYPAVRWEQLISPTWDPETIFDELDIAELEDDDPQVDQIMDRFREFWDNAPTNPDLDGKKIKIAGYVAPLDFSEQASLQEFLLVPYFGACIHVPPPPANQIIYITLKKPAKGLHTFSTVWVYGTITIDKTETDMGRAGYTMQAEALEPYSN